MNYSKPTIYTTLCFLGLIAPFLLIYYFSEYTGLTSYGISNTQSNLYVFSYTVLTILYISTAFPLYAKHAGKKLTNKKWLRSNLAFSATLLLIIYWLSQTGQNKNTSILILLNLLVLLLILLAGQFWLYLYKKANNHSSILRFIHNNFSGFSIEKEFLSENRNKLFLLHRENQEYILKIHRKSKRHAEREVLVMSSCLESHICTPKLISYNIKSTPRYILMTYCGSKLSTSNEERYYFDLGKLIAQISDISLTESILKTIKKKKITKIQKFLDNTEVQHPYLGYLALYPKFSSNYFTHGDFSLDQVMLNEDKITIIDWEAACFNYRLTDLANALSHALVIKLSTRHALAILEGYTSINTFTDNQEIKFLLGLIWSNLYDSNEVYKKNIQDQKRANYVTPLLKDRSLEEIFKLNPS